MHAAVVFLTAVVIGLVMGGLMLLHDKSVPAAVTTGLGSSGISVPVLHSPCTSHASLRPAGGRHRADSLVAPRPGSCVGLTGVDLTGALACGVDLPTRPSAKKPCLNRRSLDDVGVVPGRWGALDVQAAGPVRGATAPAGIPRATTVRPVAR